MPQFSKNQLRPRPSQGGSFLPPVVPTAKQKAWAYQEPGVVWETKILTTFNKLPIGKAFTWKSDHPNDCVPRVKTGPTGARLINETEDFLVFALEGEVILYEP